MKSKRGFTLTELVISLSLSSFVLIGLISIATAIVRNHIGAIKRGEANGITLYALQQMNREIELATHIQPNFPAVGNPPTGGSTQLKGCVNWSRYMAGGTSATTGGGQVDTDTGAPGYIAPYWFAYCIRAEAADSQGRAQNSLFRHQAAGCPDLTSLPATCGTAGAGETVSAVVFNRFYPDGGTNVFGRTSERRIITRYVVGASTPTAGDPNPVFYRVETAVTPEKALSLPGGL